MSSAPLPDHDESSALAPSQPIGIIATDDTLVGGGDGSWTAHPPPASDLCEKRRRRGSAPALVVLLGPATSGRTLENAIRNVAAPLCAWTVLVSVVDDTRTCRQKQQRPPLHEEENKAAVKTDAEEEAVLARVAAAVEPAVLRESLGPRLEALGAARHLVSADLRECGRVVHPPPPPRPLRHFGWEVHDGPCLQGVLPAAARDGAVSSFRHSDGVWYVESSDGADAKPVPGLADVVRRVRKGTFGRAGNEETAVIDARGAADYAVTGGLTEAEHVATARFDDAQLDVEPQVSPHDPADLIAMSLGSAAHLDATGRDRTGRRSPRMRFPVDPPTRFRPQNNVNDVGGDAPYPTELIRGTALNVTARPVPRLASAMVLRKACPARRFCVGLGFATCVRRARWLAQLLIAVTEQDSFGDRVAFDQRGPGWVPANSPPESNGDGALLAFPPPWRWTRPMPPKLSSSPHAPRCAASPSDTMGNDGDPRRRTFGFLFAGQLRLGRLVIPASLRQLKGNTVTAFVAMGVPALDATVRSDLEFLHGGGSVPLGALLLVNGTRSQNLRADKAEYPHERSWKTLPDLGTINIVSQQHQLFTAGTIMLLYEQRCDVRFDFIVRARPDSLFRWPLPPSALPRLYPGVLVVDSGWDFENGLSDQFAFGPAWLMGNFVDMAFLYPEMLERGRLPFTQAERVFRTSLEISDFPFARLVRPVRRMTFVVRDVHLRISAMTRRVLADLGAALPPPCRPSKPMMIAFQPVPFVEGAPPCDASLHAPVSAAATNWTSR